MLLTRVIPCLLKRNAALVKTINFNKFNYIGDPVNSIQIFNNLLVDELIFLDITATKGGEGPDFELISKITTECFMPLSYGGGVRSIGDMRKIFSLGVEKIIICSYAVENPDFIHQATAEFGSQSVIVSIDVRKNFFGRYEVFTQAGTKNTKLDPVEFAKHMVEKGAGEIFVNSIDRDGMMAGYDLALIKKVSHTVKVPVIASGGAGELKDLTKAVCAGASAVAAGSLFVYQRKSYDSVLINYPTQAELKKLFKDKR